MIRPLIFAVAVLLVNVSQLVGQVTAEADVRDYASALAKAYAALERDDTESAKAALGATSENLRGTAFKLLEQLATHKEPRQALTGSPVPKPDSRFALAVLNPTKPDATYLCDQGVVLIYDLAQSQSEPQRIVSSRAKPLMYGSYSTDGTFFVTGDTEGGILVWDTGSWQETASYLKGTQPVRYVAVNKDGSRLLAETEQGVVLWDTSRNREIGIIGERYNFGTALCFSNEQHHCATGGMFNIVIHDADSGETIRQIAHAPYTMQLCFSPDGRYIASGLRGSLNKWLGVFDVATGARVFDQAKHEKGITGLAFVDDGKCLLSTSADGTMKFWHVPSGTELLSMKMGSSIYQPSVTLDSSTILWNQRTGPRYFSIQ